jgi:hypothetical protein
MMTRKEVINSAAMAVGVSTRGVTLVDVIDQHGIANSSVVRVYVHGVYICTRQVEEKGSYSAI